ncbi:hypothetical protein [Rhodobacteraceae bacterium DSL-40]|uniref:hypothetical protein n=1 Tax=Amaricoccus sp. B4 TaxID=3368557 RepID=UPI0013A6C315
MNARQQENPDGDGVVSELHVPFFGRTQTNYPSLIAVVAGAALVWSVQSRIEWDHVVIAFAAEAGPACFLPSAFSSRLPGIIRGVAVVRDLEEECLPAMQEAKAQRPAA